MWIFVGLRQKAEPKGPPKTTPSACLSSCGQQLFLLVLCMPGI